MVNLLIGKNSNLTSVLLNKLDNAKVISARDISMNVNILEVFKNSKINIIFNNFQPALQLNNLSYPEEYVMNSIGITSKILNFCKINSMIINKIIYTSSSSVYGNNNLCSENDELKPLNLHASLKIANEKLVENFCLNNNIDYTITRVFNMYGANDNFSIISKILHAYRTNNILTIVNNGNAIRDFIHIEDVADIYVRLLNLENIPILNIGTGEGTSVKNIINLFKNRDPKFEINNIFKNELKISTSDNRLLISKLKKDKFISIEDYIEKELRK